MRILFVTANRVGDAVLSTGLLSHLAKQCPEARFTVAVGPAAASLFRAMPSLERLIEFEKRPFGGHWLALWRSCVAIHWDMVVDLRRSAIAYCLPARCRRVIPKRDDGAHRVRLIAATLGLDADPPNPVVWADAEEAEAARLIPGGTPVLAVAPAANWTGKQWRAERFAELAKRVTGPNGILPDARVAVFAAATEREQVISLLSTLPDDRVIDLLDVGDLTRVAACLKRCNFFVGNDSGLMHMAAAAGLPTLGLFGPSREEHYAPWGPKGAVVRTAQSYDQLVGASGYDHRTTGTLMDSISVDMVDQAARELWRRIEREAA